MELTLTIDRLEDNKAVLKTEDNETIVWPKDKLPDSAREGEVFTFTIHDDKLAQEDKRSLAKEILNEIINPDDKP